MYPALRTALKLELFYYELINFSSHVCGTTELVKSSLRESESIRLDERERIIAITENEINPPRRTNA